MTCFGCGREVAIPSNLDPKRKVICKDCGTEIKPGSGTGAAQESMFQRYLERGYSDTH